MRRRRALATMAFVAPETGRCSVAAGARRCPTGNEVVDSDNGVRTSVAGSPGAKPRRADSPSASRISRGGAARFVHNIRGRRDRKLGSQDSLWWSYLDLGRRGRMGEDATHPGRRAGDSQCPPSSTWEWGGDRGGGRESSQDPTALTRAGAAAWAGQRRSPASRRSRAPLHRRYVFTIPKRLRPCPPPRSGDSHRACARCPIPHDGNPGSNIGRTLRA